MYEKKNLIKNFKNHNQKLSVINEADIIVMRIQKLNNLVEAIKDYATLPDLSGQEKLEIYNQIADLKEAIRYLRENNYV